MPNYLKMNFYELLEVAPDATLEDISRAYHMALEAFGEDSVAIYSLFDQKNREELLGLIKEAFRVLSNGRSRREYDAGLFGDESALPAEAEADRADEGEADRLAVAGEMVIPDEVGDEAVAAEAPARIVRPLPPLARQCGEDLDLAQGGVLRGADLKRLRESRGVGVEELSRRTRINEEMLLSLENDLRHRFPALVYLKGFLRAYGQALGLDGDQVCRAYIDGMDS